MATPRLQSVDVYRGLAIVAMAAYHTCWDLNYYGLVETGIGTDPAWISVQRAILTAFLLLAGMGLVLGHGGGIRWRSFWKREAIVTAAALGVSAVTWFQFGDYFAYFGVLHAIALFSLLALPFVRAPLWVGIVTAVLVLFLPAVYSSDLFDPRWLAWIGFFVTTPETADLVPVFPWFGVVLIGVIGMRLARGAPAFAWSSRTVVVRVLAFMGRWSLIIYLVHQPLIFGALMPLASYVQNAEEAKLTGFLQSCRASCAPGNTEQFCTAYCACALDSTVRENLWNAPVDELKQMSTLCTAMSKP